MIIAALTTWAPRLQNVPKVIFSLECQTLMLDEIFITLSLEEFGGVCPLKKGIGEAKILWTEKNTTVWKKLHPLMDMYPDAEIINVDDDVIYPTRFVERMHAAYATTHRPVTVNTEPYHGLYTHAGYGSLVTASMFGGIRPDGQVMANVHAADLWYTYVANMNGNRYMSCPQAFEGREQLPQPQPYTTDTNINPEWDWLINHYTR